MVTGADSRTAMAVTAGGKTQVTGLVAAAMIAVVLLFFTGPLQFVPLAALGVVLISAALSLLDFSSLRQFWRMDRREFGLSMVTPPVSWQSARSMAFLLPWLWPSCGS